MCSSLSGEKFFLSQQFIKGMKRRATVCIFPYVSNDGKRKPMAKAKKIAVLKKGFYHYCENSSSMTHVQNGRKRVENLARVGEILRETMPSSEFADFHDRVTRDALLLWIRYRLFDRKLWRMLRSRMTGGLLADPRHGIIKKGALSCAACIFD